MSILQQIANPNMARIPQSIMAGRKAAAVEASQAQKLNWLQQQVAQGPARQAILNEQATQAPLNTVLKQQAVEQGDFENQKAQEFQYRSGVAKGVLAAQVAGPGEDRDRILHSILDNAEDDATRTAISSLLASPDEEMQEAQFKKVTDYFKQAGYLDMEAEKLALREKERLTRERMADAKLVEVGKKREDKKETDEAKLGLNKEKLEFKRDKWDLASKNLKSPLGKLMDDRDTKEAGSADWITFNKAIAKKARANNGFSDEVIEQNVQAILNEDMAPKDVSKRGGLQAIVLAEAYKRNPSYSFIYADANARYKQLAGTLTSKALIGGVQPLYDELREKGESLNNTRYLMVNAVANWFKKQTGDPKIVAFDNLRDDVIAETERILLGTGVLSDSKYTRALKNLRSSAGPEQMKASIDQFELVVRERLNALNRDAFSQRYTPGTSKGEFNKKYKSGYAKKYGSELLGGEKKTDDMDLNDEGDDDLDGLFD